MARRNARWLQSVNWDRVDGQGFTVTFTVRDCPGSERVWAARRVAWFKRLKRAGLLRAHWVTEWQPRSRYGGGPVPHLHGVVILPAGDDLTAQRRLIVGHWLEVAAEFGAHPLAQWVTPITTPVLWSRYVAKHAARGAENYQREAGARPAGWDRTGRMWGVLGEWPTECEDILCDEVTYLRWRRLLRAYAVSEVRPILAAARASGEAVRIGKAARLLRFAKGPALVDPEATPAQKRSASRLHGLARWVPAGVSRPLFHLAADRVDVETAGRKAASDGTWPDVARWLWRQGRGQTAAEIAAALGVPAVTVRRLLLWGELPADWREPEASADEGEELRELVTVWACEVDERGAWVPGAMLGIVKAWDPRDAKRKAVEAFGEGRRLYGFTVHKQPAERWPAERLEVALTKAEKRAEDEGRGWVVQP